jgi:hypothetical protein
MNTCPFRTNACSESCPCSKCRAVAVRAAHVLVRFNSQGKRRARRYRTEVRTHYQTKSGGYWQGRAA